MTIRSANSIEAYLNRDRSTNVISFAMREGEFSDINPQLLGDIILSVETAHRDAAAERIDFMDEVEFLVIHGLLHLLGYEHENTTAKEARRMKIRERELFSLLRQHELSLKSIVLFDQNHLPGINLVIAQIVQLTQLVQRRVVFAGNLVETIPFFDRVFLHSRRFGGFIGRGIQHRFCISLVLCAALLFLFTIRFRIALFNAERLTDFQLIAFEMIDLFYFRAADVILLGKGSQCVALFHLMDNNRFRFLGLRGTSLWNSGWGRSTADPPPPAVFSTDGSRT